MKQSLSAALVFFACFTQSSARADEITLVAPGGIRAAIEKMIPAFEQKTGARCRGGRSAVVYRAAGMQPGH